MTTFAIQAPSLKLRLLPTGEKVPGGEDEGVVTQTE